MDPKIIWMSESPSEAALLLDKIQLEIHLRFRVPASAKSQHELQQFTQSLSAINSSPPAHFSDSLLAQVTRIEQEGKHLKTLLANVGSDCMLRFFVSKNQMQSWPPYCWQSPVQARIVPGGHQKCKAVKAWNVISVSNLL